MLLQNKARVRGCAWWPNERGLAYHHAFVFVLPEYELLRGVVFTTERHLQN